MLWGSKMDMESFNKLRTEFHTNVFNARATIDPENNEDWFSLAYGWALGRGCDPKEANNFAIKVTYDE